MIKNVSIWHEDVKVILDFHVFEDLNFDFLIGYPIKSLLKDVPNSGSLNISIGKEFLLVPISRSMNCSLKDSPIIEPIKEVMAISVFD